MTKLDIVICTYNRARDLEACLEALARQRDANGDWRVTVINNNCSDSTPAVVSTMAARGALPMLRQIIETTQGLTPARVRGVRESIADWVAFVDDDCMTASDWVAEALRFARAHPEVGAFGGRVLPDWGRRPPIHLTRHGWLFAEQDYGTEPKEVANLVGAGVVLNRRALASVGWAAGPYLADRTGLGHVSGGDVEICCRLVAAGYALYYAPSLRIDHRISLKRQRLRGLLSLARGLGAGAELVSFMGAPDPELWPSRVASQLEGEFRRHVASARYVLNGRYPWRDWLIRSAFLAGQRAQHRKLSNDREARARLGGLWGRA